MFNHLCGTPPLPERIRYDPTIITLEECDHFPDFFEPALRKFGYEGVFQPKSDAPGCESGFYSDGVGVLWKYARLSLSVFLSLPLSVFLSLTLSVTISLSVSLLDSYHFLLSH